MKFDATTLSRLQFAWVIGWHILLPAFTMGIASRIALLEGLYLRRDGRSTSNSPLSGSTSLRWRLAWAS